MTRDNPGLRHDATNSHVELARAIIERDDFRRKHGAFFALGHLMGRRYEDWKAPDGTITRFYADGAIVTNP